MKIQQQILQADHQSPPGLRIRSRESESVESDFFGERSRSRESDFQICWSRSRTFLVRKQCKRVGSRSRWTFLGKRSRSWELDFEICWSRSRESDFEICWSRSRIWKFAGVGLFPSDSAALIIDNLSTQDNSYPENSHL